jgi:hypothetical protein
LFSSDYSQTHQTSLFAIYITTMAVPYLPLEIIDAIFDQANAQGNHDSLFQCALVSQALATLALPKLYQ